MEEALPRGGGHEQVGALRLLGGGEEPRVGGDAPLLGPLLLVQDAGQEEAALPIPGESIQQVGFVHGVPSSFPWGTVLGGFGGLRHLLLKVSISCPPAYCQRKSEGL